jgi:hypothetical protein
MNIDGYVKITGTELTTKASAVLQYLTEQNKLLEQQDVANRLEFEAKCVSDTAELDAYRDSGKAWGDYERARIKHTTYEPVKFLGLFKVGTNEVVSVYGINRELESINYKFWSNMYDVADLTFDALNHFYDYELDWRPDATKKYDIGFVTNLIGMADKPEIYLSIDIYQKLNALWSGLSADNTQELLVG